MVANLTRRCFLSTTAAIAVAAAPGGAAALTMTSTMSSLIADHRAKEDASIRAFLALDEVQEALTTSLRDNRPALPRETHLEDLLALGAEGLIAKRGQNRFGLYDMSGPLPADGEAMIRAAEIEIETRRRMLDIDRLTSEHDEAADATRAAFERLLSHPPADLAEAGERIRYLVASEMAGCMDERRWEMLAASHSTGRSAS